MKNLIYIVVLFWFFGVRSAYDPAFPKVSISTVIGPFQTKIECHQERTKMKEYLAKEIDEPITITECLSAEKA